MNKKTLIIAGLAVAVIAVLVLLIGQGKLKFLSGIGRSPADSLYRQASSLSLQSKDQFERAVKLYQDLIRKYPLDERAADAWYKMAEIYESQNLWQQAKDAYAKIIAGFPNFKQISEAEKRLWEMNVKILFSSLVTNKDIVYKVGPGDTLTKIASRYNTTVDLLMRSNKLGSDMIRPGARLKVSPAMYSIFVDKSQNLLTLTSGKEIVKVYTVATGKNNCTPVGKFKIVEKLLNPDWYKPGGGVVPAGSPENVLGTRWLGLSEPQYGIHGGATAKDLGSQVTEGCVRMLNPEVEELFTIVPKGTEVTIVD